MDAEVIKGIKFVGGIKEIATRIVTGLRWEDKINVESP
jgi:hypothetical protein